MDAANTEFNTEVIQIIRFALVANRAANKNDIINIQQMFYLVVRSNLFAFIGRIWNAMSQV
jgi:hypothetical protein